MRAAVLGLVLAFAAVQAAFIVNCCCAFCAEEGMARPAPPPSSSGDC